MGKRCFIPFLLVGFIALSALPALAQEWVTYESEMFNLQFNLPAGWATEIDGETLISEGEGIVFVLTAVKDASISTEALFDMQVEAMDIESEGEYEEVELQGGILAIIGSGVGMIEEEPVAIVLLAATLDENNYIAYTLGDPDAFEENEDLMVEIITSLAPLGWDEQ